MPSGTPISNISDTALWVATYRAMESERPDAIFRDPYARKLAGARGQEIVDGMVNGRKFAWPMVVRTAVMDDMIRQAVERDRVDTVVNLAAGLDTRPYRLGLPRSVRWIDADLPDILAYKKEQLSAEQPECTLELATVDLTDATSRNELCARVGGVATRALVVTEGLLVYLTREQVADLARDLLAQPAFHWWVTDLAAPQLLKRLERTWGKQLSAGNAPFRFAPAEGTAFFAARGWQEAAFRSMFEEAIRLDRTMPFARFWRFVGRLSPKKKQEEFRRLSGMVLLQRAVSRGAPTG